MSDQQDEGAEQVRYGSRFAQMFGYITPEDRSRWEQQRAQSKKNVSAGKQGAKSSAKSMMDFGDRNINAKMNAAHRIAEQEKFDESHSKRTSSHFDPRTRSIVETVDYQYTGGVDQESISQDDDLEFN